MRNVGGALAGRIFAGPTAKPTRPTSDRAREAIASAIEARRGFEGALVLDLFAGTGAFSFEALSRGARRAIAFDSDGRQARAIEKSATELGLSDRVSVVRADLTRPRALEAVGEKVDLVFADPPWAEAAEIEPLLSSVAPLLAPEGLCVVVHASRDTPPKGEGLSEVARYRYGDTAVVIYAPAAPIGADEAS
jgi:16S rRNA (guanine966-N2)-methyltransferase